MNRILVVASNSSLAIGLAVGVNDVVDLRPRQLASWIAGSERADVAVLALPSRDAAIAAVKEFQSAGCAVPVALVSNSGEDWSTPVPDYPCRVEILSLPLGRPELLSAVARLLHPTDAAVIDAATPAEKAPIHGDRAPLTADPGMLIPGEPPLLAAAAPFQSSSRRLSALLGSAARDAGLSARLRVASRAETPRLTAKTAELRDPVISEVSGPPDRGVVVATTDAQPVAGHEGLIAPPAHRPSFTTHASFATPGAPAMDLIRGLLRCVADLVSLEELAQRLADAASSRTSAAATAVLLPDGSVWEVVGGCALRPLEHRCRLSSESWLVGTVALDSRGLLIDQTDIARQRLAGAPLAGRQQLLAAPIPGVKGIVLAARDDRPFTAEELTGVVALGEHAAGGLTDALDTRALARQMDSFRGLQD